MFARIFKKSLINDTNIFDVNTFEDFIGILNELIFREIVALSIFESYNVLPKSVEENDLKWVSKFWEDFEERLGKEN